MLQSKPSRSVYALFGNKSHESVHSRKFSAPKFCSGDNIGKSVDSHALKSFGRTSVDRIPSKSARFTEKQIQRALTMQEHMGQLEEELKWAKDRIFIVEEESKKALKDMRESSEANMKVNESFSPKKIEELMTEIRALKELLYDSKEEVKVKDKDIETLRKELGKAKQFEVKMKETNSALNRLRDELNRVKTSEILAMNQHSSSKQKIEELEDEVQKSKVSEAKMLDSLKSQTKQLEQEKVEVEESKLKIASLNQSIVSLETLIKQKDKCCNDSNRKENVDYVLGETKSSSEPVLVKQKMSIDEEEDMELLKRELRLALEAEKTSKTAMDDLAAALKEVAMESIQAKENLENVKAEAERLKQLVRRTEEKYENVLDEARKEAELHKNAADRFRLEAEESHLAWNGKEMGFVSCIKRAEEERSVLQHENNKLIESLKAAEHTARTAREDNYKLRDILKQAINEANAAKAACGIAKDENSQLKDLLAAKDEAMHFLTQENERLRISEVAAYENIKEFKRLLSKASKKFKSQDTLKLPNVIAPPPSHDEQKKARKTISFDLGELKLYNDMNSDQNMEHKDPEKAEALKGTIFDPDASPRSEPRTPKKPVVHHRRESSVFTDDEETTNSEDIDHFESSNFEDSDSDRYHTRRKTMFRRVGELIKRRSFQRISTDHTTSHSHSHSHSQAHA